MTHCSELERIARYAAEWRASRPEVGEESTTDRLLYEISRQLLFARYHKFNRVEEGRTFGADWDWWFIARSVTVGWRVQAKKLKHGADHYPGLARSNQCGMQIEKLLESAEDDDRQPMYAFYCDARARAPSACRTRRGRGDGVLVADAFEVRDLISHGRVGQV